MFTLPETALSPWWNNPGYLGHFRRSRSWQISGLPYLFRSWRQRSS
ncbi:hypothetical protein THTE_2998 [Thermogutta terrifontis]|uniref:Uncharacterized protein n=1 Tax=Thermogutta terrifontis TaxID=1331910 RepID=A0A286RI03_9BACT|nr:hypothetical protein THTE_2998 [Thermogutta terrifontis]